MPPKFCVVCGGEVPEDRSEPLNQYRAECRACGVYRLSERATQHVFERAYAGGVAVPQLSDHHHLLTAVIRERYERIAPNEVFIQDFAEVEAAVCHLSDPIEAADKILLYVARRERHLGDGFVLDPEVDYPIAYARDAIEFTNLLGITQKLGFLDRANEKFYNVSLQGWRRLRELRTQEIDPASAFVAMSFGPEHARGYELGIKPVLEEVGFQTIRLDRVEHNEKIDDRIIADIRKSALLVADFTGHRQNVYFEAGFALGLGRHVIWMCHEDQVARAHFDTRQYNHVVWTNIENLRERLRNRIEATIPLTQPLRPQR